MTRRIGPVVVAALIATLTAAGCGTPGAGSHTEPAPVSSAPVSSAPVSSGPATASTSAPASTDAPSTTAAPTVTPRRPTHLRLWKFDAPVIPVQLDGTVLVPPADPTVLGWWGRPAGSATGTTLLVGHTVSTGGGTFDDLEQTSVGSVARVSGVRYRVDRVQVISKAQLARRAARLFSPSGEPKLVLVTCEGYDVATRTYADNVVVVARPVR